MISVKLHNFQNKGGGHSHSGESEEKNGKMREPGPNHSRNYNYNRFGHFARDSCCLARNNNCEVWSL